MPRPIAGDQDVDVVRERKLPLLLAGLGIQGYDAALVVVQDADGLSADWHDYRETVRDAAPAAQVAHRGLGVRWVREVVLPELRPRRCIVRTEVRRLIRPAARPVRVHRIHDAVSEHGEAIGEITAGPGIVAGLPDPLPCLEIVVIRAASLVLENEGVLAGEHRHEVPELELDRELPQSVTVGSVHADDRVRSTAGLAVRLGHHDAVMHPHSRDVRPERRREPLAPDRPAGLHAQSAHGAVVVADVHNTLVQGRDAPCDHLGGPQKLAIRGELADPIGR
mmetsp:Transcript_86361/g.270212  ORF Transcript_86361/g.270212 Transcript_86361/m.270212 type:complete len:279 (+) Transcript_86361:364-1200(+)